MTKQKWLAAQKKLEAAGWVSTYSVMHDGDHADADSFGTQWVKYPDGSDEDHRAMGLAEFKRQTKSFMLNYLTISRIDAVIAEDHAARQRDHELEIYNTGGHI